MAGCQGGQEDCQSNQDAGQDVQPRQEANRQDGMKKQTRWSVFLFSDRTTDL